MKVLAAFILLCVVADVAAPQRSVALTRRITFYNPAWSPDGKKILFESSLDGPESVYTINADGSALTRLTKDAFNNAQPSWSPDGARIVYSSERDGNTELYIIAADGSNPRKLTSMQRGNYYQASFSPDGRMVVFQGRPDNRETRDRIYLINADGTGFRELSDSSYAAEGPRWSANGRSITFNQKRYPKRFWGEMSEAEMRAANASARTVAINLDGTGLTPAQREASPALPAGVSNDAEASRDGKSFAYNKTVDGWAGLYVFAGGQERLLVGGAGAGPIGYLRTATPTASVDTMNSYTTDRSGGALDRGNGAYVIESIRRVGAQRWERSSSWRDSTGKVTATQTTRTKDGSLATEVESVRADVDSATLLVSGNRVTGWVVPAGQPAQLFDGTATEERFASTFVVGAIVKSKPQVGKVFYFPSASLYGGKPLEVRTDSIRVVRRDTLTQGTMRIPVVVLERPGGGVIWADETTGAEVASRGNAGPQRWWWHVRRGVTPPRTTP